MLGQVTDQSINQSISNLIIVNSACILIIGYNYMSRIVGHPHLITRTSAPWIQFVLQHPIHSSNLHMYCMYTMSIYRIVSKCTYILYCTYICMYCIYVAMYYDTYVLGRICTFVDEVDYVRVAYLYVLSYR